MLNEELELFLASDLSTLWAYNNGLSWKAMGSVVVEVYCTLTGDTSSRGSFNSYVDKKRGVGLVESPRGITWQRVDNHPEKWLEGYPIKSTKIFYRVHPDFSRVPPRHDFSRVLNWFVYDLQVWNPAFFKLPPWKKPGRSYPLKNFQTEKSGHGGILEKPECRLNGRLLYGAV